MVFFSIFQCVALIPDLGQHNYNTTVNYKEPSDGKFDDYKREIWTNSSDSKRDAVEGNRWTIKNSSKHSKHEAETWWKNGNKATPFISLFIDGI